MSKKHPLRLGDRVVLDMPTERLKGSTDIWTERQKDRHLGIVVQVFPSGNARVWDTAENDWWCCRSKHLSRLP